MKIAHCVSFAEKTPLLEKKHKASPPWELHYSSSRKNTPLLEKKAVWHATKILSGATLGMCAISWNTTEWHLNMTQGRKYLRLSGFIMLWNLWTGSCLCIIGHKNLTQDFMNLFYVVIAILSYDYVHSKFHHSILKNLKMDSYNFFQYNFCIKPRESRRNPSNQRLYEQFEDGIYWDVNRTTTLWGRGPGGQDSRGQVHEVEAKFKRLRFVNLVHEWKLRGTFADPVNYGSWSEKLHYFKPILNQWDYPVNFSLS